MVSILLVACLLIAKGRSSFVIPSPLSIILIKSIPPLIISISIVVELASIEFSTNSLITELGRSITSPAAILLAINGSKTLIFIIFIS